MIEEHEIIKKNFTLNNSFEDNHCKDMMNNWNKKINNKLIHWNKHINEIIDSILEGLKSNKVKTNLILCMMRHFTYEENLEIIKLTKIKGKLLQYFNLINPKIERTKVKIPTEREKSSALMPA